MLIEQESKGVIEVVSKDERLPHLFHALLTAELIDDAGWKLLLELADDASDDDARREFRKRAETEETHVVFMRDLVSGITRKAVLDQTAPQPVAP